MRITMLLARRSLRRRPGSWVSMALLVALAGTVTLGCLAGARRTASAHARYLRATDGADTGYSSDPHCGDRPCTVADFAAIDGVAEVSRFVRLASVLERPDGSLSPDDDEAEVLGLAGGRPWAVNRPLVEHGRLPRAAAVDEVFVNTAFAERHHLHVGDALAMRTFTLDQVDGLLAEAQRGGPKVGRSVRLRVVGIGLTGSPLTQGSAVRLPEAAARRMEPFAAAFSIRLDRGPDGVAEFTRAVKQRFGLVADELAGAEHARAQRTVRPYVTALTAYGALAALVGLVLIGQGVVRQVRADGEEASFLSAIGVTRRQRHAGLVVTILLVAVAGTAVAVAGAYVASWWTPVGPVRPFDPDGGMRADALVVAAGATGWIVLATAAGLLGIVLADRRSPSVAVQREARIVRQLPVAAATAVRFARPLSVRASARTGSARTAVVGVSTAVILLAGVFTFAAGLHRLVDTAPLYGWNYDASIFLGYQSEPPQKAAAAAAVVPQLTRDRSVAGVTQLAGSDLDVGGVTMTVTGTAGAGGAFTLTSGHPPSAANEIVLGDRTASRVALRHVDGTTVRIGDGHDRSRSVEYTVVGRAVFPDTASDGAWVTMEGLRRVAPDATVSQIGVRFARAAPESRRAATLQQATATLHRHVHDPTIDFPKPPSDTDGLVAIDGLPLVLVATLALAALVTLVHTLQLALRTRRNDLATLRACGYSTRQVWSTVLLYAALVVGVSLLIGLPVGVTVGRWLWSAWASSIGVVDSAVTPVLVLLALSGAAMAAAAVAAIVPARRASRLPVAAILRTE